MYQQFTDWKRLPDITPRASVYKSGEINLNNAASELMGEVGHVTIWYDGETGCIKLIPGSQIEIANGQARHTTVPKSHGKPSGRLSIYAKAFAAYYGLEPYRYTVHRDGSALILTPTSKKS